MVPPVLRFTIFEFTVMAPPVAVAAVPEVAADSVPPFWIVRALARMLMFPPAPVPSALVKMPLPCPSSKTD